MNRRELEVDWKHEAVSKLRDLTAKRQALENIPAEIKRLELEYAGIRSSTKDSTPVAGGTNAREDAMLSNIVRREDLARQLQSAKLWIATVEASLAVLDEEERMILDRLYIHCTRGALERLMNELGVEKSAVYRRRDKALRRFTMAMYGGAES